MKYLKTYEEKQGITFKEWLKKNPQDINTTEIYCGDEKLIDIHDIQDFKNLKELYCPYNNLTGLNLKGLDNNKLTHLDLNLDKIEKLFCFDNKLPYKDLEEYLEWYQKEYPDRWEARKFNF